MGSLTILLTKKLKVQLKMLANKINTAPLQPVNKHLSNFFTAAKMHYNYKLDENILKTLIQRNILPTDHNKKNSSYTKINLKPPI